MSPIPRYFPKDVIIFSNDIVIRYHDHCGDNHKVTNKNFGGGFGSGSSWLNTSNLNFKSNCSVNRWFFNNNGYCNYHRNFPLEFLWIFTHFILFSIACNRQVKLNTFCSLILNSFIAENGNSMLHAIAVSV